MNIIKYSKTCFIVALFLITTTAMPVIIIYICLVSSYILGPRDDDLYLDSSLTRERLLQQYWICEKEHTTITVRFNLDESVEMIIETQTKGNSKNYINKYIDGIICSRDNNIEKCGEVASSSVSTIIDKCVCNYTSIKLTGKYHALIDKDKYSKIIATWQYIYDKEPLTNNMNLVSYFIPYYDKTIGDDVIVIFYCSSDLDADPGICKFIQPKSNANHAITQCGLNE